MGVQPINLNQNNQGFGDSGPKSVLKVEIENKSNKISYCKLNENKNSFVLAKYQIIRILTIRFQPFWNLNAYNRLEIYKFDLAFTNDYSKRYT